MVTAACLWWTFRDTDWDGMWASLASARWIMLVPYLALLGGVHVARTLRWGHLLSGIERVPFRPLNEASAIGAMMLLVLPFRLGEFARPVLIAQRSKIRRSAAMTSVVLERIVDGLIVAVLLRALLFFVPREVPNYDQIAIAANLVFLVFSGGFVGLLVARWQHDLVIGLLRRTLGRVAPGITDRVIDVVDGFIGALRQLPGGRDGALFFFWTAVYWLLLGWSVSVLAAAFDCQGAAAAACEPLSLGPFQSYFVLCALVVGAMIPLAPGSAGTAQLAMLIAIGVFFPESVVRASGVAWANVQWLVPLVFQIALGVVFMLRSHLSFRELAGELREAGPDGSGGAP